MRVTAQSAVARMGYLQIESKEFRFPVAFYCIKCEYALVGKNQPDYPVLHSSSYVRNDAMDNWLAGKQSDTMVEYVRSRPNAYVTELQLRRFLGRHPFTKEQDQLVMFRNRGRVYYRVR